jgi:hypothetical protein
MQRCQAAVMAFRSAVFDCLFGKISSRVDILAGRRLLFVNKKKQKNFEICAPLVEPPVAKGAKVFWFFFSKKNRLPEIFCNLVMFCNLVTGFAKKSSRI